MDKKYFIYAGVFVCCLLAGLAAVKIIRGLDDSNLTLDNDGLIDTETSDIVICSPEKTQIDPIDSVSTDSASDLNEQKESREQNSSSSLAVEINNEEQEELEAERRKKKEEEAHKKAEANRMSAEEFQQRILSNDVSILGGKNPKVAKSINFSFSNIRDGESKPYDVNSIRDKIHMSEEWKSIKVISVGYDNSYKINSAIVEIIYND